MRNHQVENGEERLPIAFIVPPVGLRATFVPRLANQSFFRRRVVVRLDVVGGVKALFAQEGGEALHPLRHGEPRAHLLST